MTIDYLIIANLMSGRGETEARLKEVKKTMCGQGYSFESIEIREPKRISKITMDNWDINRGVICIGGDGTVSETVALMINNRIDVPLRIIPTGTANIIGGTLGIGDDRVNLGNCTVNSVSEIYGVKGDRGESTTKTVDVGAAEYGSEKEYFLLGIGLGFDEKFIELAKKGLKTKLGSLSYIFIALRELISIKPIPITIETNNEKKDIAIALLVAFNLQPKILKAFPLFPFKQISSSDGKLNIFYVEYKNKLQAIAGALFFHVLGRISFGAVKQIITNVITISSSIPCPTQIDGEIRGELPVKLSVGTEKIRLYL